MRVTVWRHGEAGAAPRDEDRPLTERGRLSLAAAMPEFHTLCASVEPTLIHFSPLLRTVQTAGIIAKHCAAATLVSCDALAPGTNIREPESFLADSDATHLVLVTHQPFVSELIWHWLGDMDVPPLSPGGFCLLDLIAPTRGGAVLLHAVPDILDRYR